MGQHGSREEEVIQQYTIASFTLDLFMANTYVREVTDPSSFSSLRADSLPPRGAGALSSRHSGGFAPRLCSQGIDYNFTLSAVVHPKGYAKCTVSTVVHSITITDSDYTADAKRFREP